MPLLGCKISASDARFIKIVESLKKEFMFSLQQLFKYVYMQVFTYFKTISLQTEIYNAA